MLSVAIAAFASCDVVQRLSLPIAEGLVRSEQNSHEGGVLKAACPCGDDEQQRACAAEGTSLTVPFNTRSYLLRTYDDGRCAGATFGAHDYSCVDYTAGSQTLSGKTLSFSVDLSGVGCGCNAAFYLVSMAQNRNASACHDYYCDANSVCGEACAELDLMEANRVAWVSTVHVADDANGEGFGQAHYTLQPSHRLQPSDDAKRACAYGPSDTCTIDTRKRFMVSIDFSPPTEPFEYSVTLSQGSSRSAKAAGISYTAPPQKGHVASAAQANTQLRRALDDGMVLVASYWAGGSRAAMGWLDSQCSSEEIEAWGCSDAFSEHPEWAWK